MHDDHDMDERDERLRALAGDYHRPLPTPREEMWAAIRSRVRQAAPGAPPVGGEGEREHAVVIPIGGEPRSRRWSLPWLGTAAAAAMIAIGFALGRLSGPRVGPSAGEPPIAAAPGGGEEAFRTAAAEHLARSEELLMLVRTDARAGRVDRSVGEWGGALLVETRLLLDSPVGSDPQLRPLLEDLELLLAQVAMLGHQGLVEGRGREELSLIAEGMDAQDMLPRIQAVLPVGAGA
jgi:hypothetical protein